MLGEAGRRDQILTQAFALLEGYPPLGALTLVTPGFRHVHWSMWSPPTQYPRMAFCSSMPSQEANTVGANRVPRGQWAISTSGPLHNWAHCWLCALAYRLSHLWSDSGRLTDQTSASRDFHLPVWALPLPSGFLFSSPVDLWFPG